jgi:type III secretory pathway component EscR
MLAGKKVEKIFNHEEQDFSEPKPEKAFNIHEMFIQFKSILKKNISEEDMEFFQRILTKMCENLEENILQENQL